MGQIEVAVPRSREHGSPADVMGRYRRRTEELDNMIAEAYMSGVSQRKMGELTGALMGERVRVTSHRSQPHRSPPIQVVVYDHGDRFFIPVLPVPE